MAKPKKYCTIKETGQHELLIKKSRFIASLSRCSNAAEAEAFISSIKKAYHDATHNTFAYTIGFNHEIAKASDNGEPAGTAGVPELKALQLMDLHNTVAVVTRYFGGIKLGAGGLIRAYSNSISAAAKAIGIVERIPQRSYAFQIPYAAYGEVSHYLAQAKIAIKKRQFGTSVNLTILIDDDPQQIKTAAAALTNLLAGQIKLQPGPLFYREQTKTSNQ